MEKRIPKPKAPCKNCAERSVRCHETCKRYLTYRKKQDEYNKAVRNEKMKHFPGSDDYA